MSDWQTTKCIPSLQRPRLHSQALAFLIWPSHLWGSSELKPTGAELGLITESPGPGPAFSLCRCHSAVYLAGTRAQKGRAGCSGPPHHSMAAICHFSHEMKPFMKWNEFPPKMKRHKSAVINLLVRLLQLSPVEDIWTADWLMPAVRRASRAPPPTPLFLPTLLSAFQRGF